MSSEEPKKVDDNDEVSVTFKDLVSTISVLSDYCEVQNHNLL